MEFRFCFNTSFPLKLLESLSFIKENQFIYVKFCIQTQKVKKIDTFRTYHPF